MKIKVLKFGGSSISTHQARYQAAMKVVSAKEQGFSPVVVVSAIGRSGQPYATDTLLEMIHSVDPAIKPDPRELDLMLACGEIVSASLFAHTLKTLGHTAQSFRGGQAGIRTDGVYGNARIVGIKPSAITRSIHEGHIPVVCGFQGLHVSGDGMPGGELTTLGRGGSDTTAAALGAALKAESVEIYTDIDGIKVANPQIVPEAQTLPEMSYEEIAEFAHLGAKVLHPRAAEIAMQYQIPLCVKSSFTDEKGTNIAVKADHRTLTGVTHTGRLIHVKFNLSQYESEHQKVIQQRVFQLLAYYGINLYMIDLNLNDFGFAVHRDQFVVIEELLDGLVIPVSNSTESTYILQVGVTPSKQVESQSYLMSSLGQINPVVMESTENCTMVSLVGRIMMDHAKYLRQILNILQESNIHVLQVSDSEMSISLLILESETEKAVRTLYDLYF